jgi:hypothetical protein
MLSARRLGIVSGNDISALAAPLFALGIMEHFGKNIALDSGLFGADIGQEGHSTLSCTPAVAHAARRNLRENRWPAEEFFLSHPDPHAPQKNFKKFLKRKIRCATNAVLSNKRS